MLPGTRCSYKTMSRRTVQATYQLSDENTMSLKPILATSLAHACRRASGRSSSHLLTSLDNFNWNQATKTETQCTSSVRRGGNPGWPVLVGFKVSQRWVSGLGKWIRGCRSSNEHAFPIRCVALCVTPRCAYIKPPFHNDRTEIYRKFSLSLPQKASPPCHFCHPLGAALPLPAILTWDLLFICTLVSVSALVWFSLQDTCLPLVALMAERHGADSRNMAAFLTPRLRISTLSAVPCLVRQYARRRQMRRRLSEIISLKRVALLGNCQFGKSTLNSSEVKCLLGSFFWFFASTAYPRHSLHCSFAEVDTNRAA